jgi:hypothetical protein
MIITCKKCLAKLRYKPTDKNKYPINVMCPECKFEFIITGEEVNEKFGGIASDILVLSENTNRYSEQEGSFAVVLSRLNERYKSIAEDFNILKNMCEKELNGIKEICSDKFEKLGVNPDMINQDKLNEFISQPFFGFNVNTGNELSDSFNKIIFSPSFIKYSFGISIFSSLSYNVYLVNPVTMNTFPLNKSLMEYLGIESPLDIKIKGDKIIGGDIDICRSFIESVTEDIDNSAENISLIISKHDSLLMELAINGVFPMKDKVSKELEIERGERDMLLSGSRNLGIKKWMIDVINKKRVVISNGNFSNVTSLCSLIKAITNRCLIVSEKALPFSAKGILSIVTGGPNKQKSINEFMLVDFSKLDFILITMEAMIDLDFIMIRELMSYDGILCIFKPDPNEGFMMRNNTEMKTYLMPHALCPYCSINESMRQKKEQPELARLLLTQTALMIAGSS